MKKWLNFLVITLWFGLGLTGCGQDARNPSGNSWLNVVATTTIVGDVVSQVGGDLISLSVLLPVGADPHSFNPSPQDMARVAEADVIFANGSGLESFLDPLIESAGAADRIVYVSDGVALLETKGALEHEGEAHAGEVNHGIDPHTWENPNNVVVWTHNIEHCLSDLDPENTAAYKNNAQRYILDLEELDRWIRQQVAQIPEANRVFVTDHEQFGYFADAYGFKLEGTLIPGYSTLAEPSAQEMAEIEDAITGLGVKAVFVGNTANPTLAERVSQDTGAPIFFVYTGSLSEPGGEAGTYIEYMRYNTNIFVEALK